MTFRNERKLYRRKCDASGVEMISIYAPDSPYRVYSSDAWWNAHYDPLQYGREYDFSRTFFEQFYELDRAVPKLGIYNVKSENAAFTNYASENKNCYLLVSALGDEDCYYGYRVFYCRDLVDCYDCRHCELCYECRQCTKLYNSNDCVECHNSSNLVCCHNCIGCDSCFGCVNLRNARFCIFNDTVPAAEYEKRVGLLKQELSRVTEQVAALRRQLPVKALHNLECEQCSGDYLTNCKNCFAGFQLKNCEDCYFVLTGENNRNCVDITLTDNSELCYQSGSMEQSYNVLCSQIAWYCHDIYYSHLSLNSHHLFGCSGMKQQEYCVLNKQYPPQEWEELVSKIIYQMEKNNEWGEFFPARLSPFAYNESFAQTHYPLAPDQAIKLGSRWLKEDARQYQQQTYSIPSDVKQVADNIIDQILSCKRCKRNYRIIAQELFFYRKQELSVPERCPDCRHAARLSQLSPRQLRTIQCHNCGQEVLTTNRASEEQLIYCDTCFNQSVYF